MSYLTFPALERCGRLGNQLWQIASTIGLARRYGMDPLFPPTWSYRQFFSIPDELFGTEPGTESYTLHDVSHLKGAAIYLQDLSLFDEDTAEIEKMLAPRRIEWDMLKESTLCIHVRRGDNLVQAPFYPLPTLDYYLRSVKDHPDHDVLIFGDDHPWNRDVLVPHAQAVTARPVHAIQGVPRPKEHEPNYMSAPILDWRDLFLAARCDAFCLSNSTLGWWMAYLSRSDDVVYPDPWYGPAQKEATGFDDHRLMMPELWRSECC
jgi:hypothetical protein